MSLQAFQIMESMSCVQLRLHLTTRTGIIDNASTALNSSAMSSGNNTALTLAPPAPPEFVPYQLPLFEGQWTILATLMSVPVIAGVVTFILGIIMGQTSVAKGHGLQHKVTPSVAGFALGRFPRTVVVGSNVVLMGIGYTAVDAYANHGAIAAGLTSLACLGVAIAVPLFMLSSIERELGFDLVDEDGDWYRSLPRMLHWSVAVGTWRPWAAVGRFGSVFAGFRDKREWHGNALLLFRSALMGMIAAAPATTDLLCTVQLWCLALVALIFGICTLLYRPQRVIALNFPLALSSILAALGFVAADLGSVAVHAYAILGGLVVTYIGMAMSLVALGVEMKRQSALQAVARTAVPTTGDAAAPSGPQPQQFNSLLIGAPARRQGLEDGDRNDNGVALLAVPTLYSIGPTRGSEATMIPSGSVSETSDRDAAKKIRRSWSRPETAVAARELPSGLGLENVNPLRAVPQRNGGSSRLRPRGGE